MRKMAAGIWEPVFHSRACVTAWCALTDLKGLDSSHRRNLARRLCRKALMESHPFFSISLPDWDARLKEQRAQRVYAILHNRVGLEHHEMPADLRTE